MRYVGMLLLWLGFIFTAWVASLDETAVQWGRYAIGLGACIVGVVLLQLGTRSEAKDGEKLSGDIANLTTSIDRIVSNITMLDGEKDKLNPYDAHGRIDELFVDDLITFVDARKSIGHVHSLQDYAEVMNHFAAGERYLNRVWSASVDGYIDEVKEYLGRSRDEFVRAQELLRALQGA